jgi:hypothetical protein
MATSTGKAQCVTCGKEKVAYKCAGCSQDFCFNHLADHRQILDQQFDEVEHKRNLLRQKLTEQTTNPEKHSLIQQIDQWENDSINKIHHTAEEARQLLLKHTTKHIEDIEVKLIHMTEQLKQIRQENDFNEIHLKEFKEKLRQLEEQLNKPSNISIRQDSSSFIKKIYVLTAGKSFINIDKKVKFNY